MKKTKRFEVVPLAEVFKKALEVDGKVDGKKVVEKGTNKAGPKPLDIAL